jgi:SAM-dependent methyltransferase
MTRTGSRLYPGVETFGFYPVDGTFPFLLRLHELLPPGGVVLDFGAGRGGQAGQATGIKKHLLDFRNRAGKVIGADVDPAVLGNPLLDQAVILSPDGSIPLEDNSVDLVVADWVCEHLPDPLKSFREIFRVLKPGGWVGFRTPNKWHYSMIASRLIPDRHHAKVLASAQKGRQERDVFPKHYLMNTPAACRSVLRSAGFTRELIVSHEPEPVYLHFNQLAFAVGAVYQRFAAFFPTHAGRLVLMGFGQKPLD